MAQQIQPPPVEGYGQSSNPGVIGQVIQPYYNGLNHSRPLTYNKTLAKGFGVTQMAIGIICVVFNAALIAAHVGDFNVHFIGYGIWSGVVFFVAGLINFLSGKKEQSKCLIISTMVMDIIASCFTPIVFSFGIIDSSLARGFKERSNYPYNNYNYYNSYYSKPNKSFDAFYDATIALSTIMVLLSILEAVISITSSALCCRAVCCTGTPTAIGVPYYFPTNQQILYLPNNTVVTPTAPFPSQSQPIGQFNYASQYEPEPPIPQVPGGSGLPSYSPPKYDAGWNMDAKSAGIN